MNRQEDLMKVFDHTWRANHNDTAKRGREKECEFANKMFGTNRGPSPERKVVTPEMQVNDLTKKINDNRNFQNQVRVNNIVNKWK